MFLHGAVSARVLYWHCGINVLTLLLQCFGCARVVLVAVFAFRFVVASSCFAMASADNTPPRRIPAIGLDGYNSPEAPVVAPRTGLSSGSSSSDHYSPGTLAAINLLTEDNTSFRRARHEPGHAADRDDTTAVYGVLAVCS